MYEIKAACVVFAKRSRADHIERCTVHLGYRPVTSKLINGKDIGDMAKLSPITLEDGADLWQVVNYVAISDCSIIPSISITPGGRNRTACP